MLKKKKLLIVLTEKKLVCWILIHIKEETLTDATTSHWHCK